VLLWRTLCQWNNSLEVEYLDVYYPTKDEIENPIQYANNVRKLMAEKLKVPTTEHSYEDALLMIDAMHNNLSPDSTVSLELIKVKQLYDLDLKGAKDILKKFAAMNISKDGRLDMDGFCDYLSLPKTPYTEDLFHLFDVDGDGTIDFNEFVTGLSAISRQASTAETIELAFEVFDENHDGRISPKEFKAILSRIPVFQRITEIEIDNWFKRVDRDQSGSISHFEFVAYATEHPEYVKLAENLLLKKKQEMLQQQLEENKPKSGKDQISEEKKKETSPEKEDLESNDDNKLVPNSISSEPSTESAELPLTKEDPKQTSSNSLHKKKKKSKKKKVSK